MIEYDPVKNLVYYPGVAMSRFGRNPFSENLYRIVFASSRRHLIGGTWPDGSTGYRWRPRYRHVGDHWILERWRPAIEFGSERQWNAVSDPISGWPLYGPYPSRGEYDLVWTFDQGVVHDNLEKIIASVESARQRRSYEDVRGAWKQEYEAEEKETRANTFEDIKDGLTAFGCAPISYGHKYGRGTKTAPNLISAQEAGLPIPRTPRKRDGFGVTSTMVA